MENANFTNFKNEFQKFVKNRDFYCYEYNLYFCLCIVGVSMKDVKLFL